MLAHKDRDPKDTIKKIKNILLEMGVSVHITDRDSFSDHCHSVRLETKGIPGVGVNGKGTSESLALASAYAEFIERLLNRVIFRESYGSYGLMKMHDHQLPDSVEMSYGELLDEQRNVLECLFKEDPEKLSIPSNRMFECVPFYNVTCSKIEYLPLRLIKHACMTNGMCAGNTPEEALSHGLCEISERYVARQISTPKEQYKLPTIPSSSINKDKELSKLIAILKSNGFNVIIKDCSLEGSFPVVATIIARNGKCIVRFGSDPVFSVAVQRCITETFQGIGSSDTEFDAMAERIDLSIKTKNPAYFEAASLLLSSGKPKYPQAFQNKFSGNADALKLLTGNIQKKGYSIYVRDASYLGFPVYHVFIPGMSELEMLSQNTLDIICNSNFVKKCLLGLKKTTPSNMRKCLTMLDNSLGSPLPFRTPEEMINVISEIKLEHSVHYNDYCMPEYLLALMCNRIGDFEKAFNYLDAVVKKYQFANPEDLNYFLCSLLYFKFKSDNTSKEDQKSTLEEFFGKDLAEEVILSFSKPNNTFRELSVPECGDCSVCQVSKQCYFDKWKELDLKVIKKMKENPIDQRRFANLF